MFIFDCKVTHNSGESHFSRINFLSVTTQVGGTASRRASMCGETPHLLLQSHCLSCVTILPQLCHDLASVVSRSCLSCVTIVPQLCHDRASYVFFNRSALHVSFITDSSAYAESSEWKVRRRRCHSSSDTSPHPGDRRDEEE